MKTKDAIQWIADHCTGAATRYYCNNMSYCFATMTDGWIAIFDVTEPNEWVPKIQASDISHAESYCQMIEPIRVPVTKI